jgi:hypothetical protein
MTTPNDPGAGAPSPTRWYDLFSRGARDWLRHNRKLREAVKAVLPDLLAGADLSGHAENRTVRVPVRLLEHYRFRLREPETGTGAGQGQGVSPGDVLREGREAGPASGGSGAGSGQGGIELQLELRVDEILDWLWEELALPNLAPLPGASAVEDELVREGWNKRGPRSRLDRRRTLREAVKRRAAQPGSPPFTDDDLRYRQLAVRRRPTTEAALVFVLDVSSSMGEEARKLAKTFFFWSLQGLRRQYGRIETAFVAHTVEAWEFDEAEFFQVRGSGGTRASSGLGLAVDLLRQRFDPSRYNDYLFYASDGDNFPEDREGTRALLKTISGLVRFAGYLEVPDREVNRLNTEMARLFRESAAGGAPVGSYAARSRDDVWQAIRRFFLDQAGQAA